MAASAPNPVSAEVIERLKAIVGPQGFLDAKADVAPYCRSWRDDWMGDVAIVLRPKSTAEVAALVKICAETGTPHRAARRQYRIDRRQPAQCRPQRGDYLDGAHETGARH